MRITMRTDLAIRILMACAVNAEAVLRRQDIARRCHASEHHMALIINRLARLGYVETLRGRHGGVRLGQSPATITIGGVFRALEADFPIAECFTGQRSHCPLADHCKLRDALRAAQEAFIAVLDSWTLEDLVGDNAGLSTILAISGQGERIHCGAH